MAKYISILFLFVCFNSISQNQVPKEIVENVFNEIKIEKHRGTFEFNSEKSWKFNNSDSVYFKQDTLIGIMNKSGKYLSSRKTVNWYFYKKNKFTKRSESFYYRSIERSAIRFPDDYFSIKIYAKQNETRIDVFGNDNIIVESFNVIAIEINNEYSKVVLVRRL
jgi:hypothetical protein